MPDAPNTYLPLAARALQRARLVRALRGFFDRQDFVEVDAPVLLRAPAPERYIAALSVSVHDASGQSHPYFLQTSPELAMKRLVAAGLSKIYHLAPVFRDFDASTTHRPEFRMLEWYRAHADFTDVMRDCESLCQHMVQTFGAPGLKEEVWRKPFERISMQQAFIEHAGFDILEALEPDTLRQKLTSIGVFHQPEDSWDDLFGRVFVGQVEPKLLARAGGAPFFLTYFPAPLASLARVDPRDNRQAERFELYGGGLELANGFGELTCATTQRARFEDENRARQQAGWPAYPLDENFLYDLNRMPATSGIALGVERLWMVLSGASDIADVALLGPSC